MMVIADLEKRVLKDHPLRTVKTALRAAGLWLAQVRERLEDAGAPVLHALQAASLPLHDFLGGS